MRRSKSPRPVLEIRTGDDESAHPWMLVTARGEVDMDNAGQLVDAITTVADSVATT